MPISDEGDGVYIDRSLHQNQNQNSLLVNSKMTIPHQGLTEEDKFLALTREVNLDTQSSKSSAQEMRESGRKKAFLVGFFTSRGNLKDH